MATHMPGMLIVVEGIDGAGKSTLVKRVAEELQKDTHSVVMTKEPGGTPLGLELRALLQHQPIPITPRAECLLFAADRAQHFADVVIPALQQGLVVISDRMSDSSLAYQGYGRGHDLAMIKTLNQWTMHGITPDITIYLEIPLDSAYTRIHIRNAQPTIFEQEKSSFMKRVAQGFDEIYREPRPSLLILDALHDQETLAKQAHAFIKKIIAARKRE